MFQLIYVSAAHQEFQPAMLSALLQESRERNARDGITGILLHASGNFMQALEGDEAAVRETYGRINRDPRHKNIITLAALTVGERLFTGWEMAFRESASLPEEQRREVSRFFEQTLVKPTTLNEGNSAIFLLLAGFARTMR